jgi:hypothetical protein
MPSNIGPTAFQANAFQTLPLAFQIDTATEEAPQTGPSFTAEATTANTWVTETIANQMWTPEDEPGP